MDVQPHCYPNTGDSCKIKTEEMATHVHCGQINTEWIENISYMCSTYQYSISPDTCADHEDPEDQIVLKCSASL